MKKISLIALALFPLIFVIMSAVQAQTPQDTLNQYVSDLQKNPNDNALRENIIKYVQMMKPAPALPLEADKFEGRAEFAIKNAKSEADFLDAAKEYEKALLIAPWVSAYYFNQGIALEKAGKLKEAKQSFEFYLLAQPDARDAREVRKRIAGLEYASEKAVKESSPEAIATKKQNDYEAWLKKLDGARYIRNVNTDRDGGTWWIEIKGDTITQGLYLKWSKFSPEDVGKNQQWSVAKIVGKKFEGKRVIGLGNESFRGKISDDGNRITTQEMGWMKYEEYVYERER